MEATAPGRAALELAGIPSSRLIVWHTRDNPAASVSIQFAGTLEQLAGAKTRGDDRRVPVGQGRIKVNLRRLRKTFVLANQPDLIQHSRDTRDRVYVLPDPRTKREARDAIEAGVNDAVEFARAQFRVALRRAETDPAGDTATATCGDYHHSPFSEHGTGCRASFLLCFICPNAVITPRHLPRLALLHRSLEDLRAVLPPEEWAQDWDVHHQRLTSIKQAPDFTAAEWDDALTAATDDDRQIIEDLLTKGWQARRRVLRCDAGRVDASREHWEGVYAGRPVDEVSWFEPSAVRSLALISRTDVPVDAGVIDVGAGAGLLVDGLLAAGFEDVTALDVAAEALAVSRARLGADAGRINWMVADVLGWEPVRSYRVWHDRAVFHFLTEPADRDRYRRVLSRALAPGGFVVLGAFAQDGPLQCSGLPTARYSTEALAAQFPGFDLIDAVRDEHRTPWGAVQPFSWVLLAGPGQAPV